MKKLIPLFVLLVGASGAFAQGVVLFGNSNLPRPTSTPPGPDRRVLDSDGITPLRNVAGGTVWMAQLMYMNNSGTWTADATPAAFFGSTTSQGYWQGANRTLNNAGGATSPTIQLYVRAWDGTGGLSYDEAVAQGRKVGQSNPFSYTEEFNPPPNNTADKWMDNFASFRLVPEPSVIGLGVIGIGALFLLRRRK